jgi:outer membrane lipopolysaccharide assembly protein LptE/RlpB
MIAKRNFPAVLRRVRVVVLLALLATGLTGCVGYKLGSMLPADIRTVYVPTFHNDTLEPLLEVETTRQAISAIQRDGSLRIAAEDVADAILTVRLNNFEIMPIGYDVNRRAAAEEYRMYITASFELTRRTTQEVLVQQGGVRGESTFLLTGDLTSAKQAGIPDAAEDLAQLLIGRIVEAW